jgi:hypothetical protein
MVLPLLPRRSRRQPPRESRYGADWSRRQSASRAARQTNRQARAIQEALGAEVKQKEEETHRLRALAVQQPQRFTPEIPSPSVLSKIGSGFFRAMELFNRPFQAAAGASEAERQRIQDFSLWQKFQEGTLFGGVIPIPGALAIEGAFSTLRPGETDATRAAGITPDMSLRERAGQLIKFQEERPSRFPGEKFIGETVTSLPTVAVGTALSPLRAAPALARATGAARVPGVMHAAEAIKAADVGLQAASEFPFKLAGKGLGRLPGVSKPIEPLAKLIERVPSRIRPPVRGILGPIARGLANESPGSIVRNETTRVHDTLNLLREAYGGKGKTFKRLFQDLEEGAIDPDAVNVLVNPHNIATLEGLQANVKNLSFVAAKSVADADPDMALLTLGTDMMRLRAGQLGVPLARESKTVEKVMASTYNYWRAAVLSTPWYVLQNVMENQMRLMEIGVAPGLKGIPAEQLFAIGGTPSKTLANSLRATTDYIKHGYKGVATASEAVVDSISSNKLLAIVRAGSYWDAVAMSRTYLTTFNKALASGHADDAVGSIYRSIVDNAFIPDNRPDFIDPANWSLMRDAARSAKDVAELDEKIGNIIKDPFRSVIRPTGDEMVPEAAIKEVAGELQRAMRGNDRAKVDEIFKRATAHLGDSLLGNQQAVNKHTIALLDTAIDRLDRLGVKSDAFKGQVRRMRAEVDVEGDDILKKLEGDTEAKSGFELSVSAQRQQEDILNLGIHIRATKIAGEGTPDAILRADTFLSEAAGVIETVTKEIRGLLDPLRRDMAEMGRMGKGGASPDAIRKKLREIYDTYPELERAVTQSLPIDILDKGTAWSGYFRVRDSQWRMRHSRIMEQLTETPDATDIGLPSFLGPTTLIDNYAAGMQGWRTRVKRRMDAVYGDGKQGRKAEANAALAGHTKGIRKALDTMGQTNLRIRNEAHLAAGTLVDNTFGNPSVKLNLDDLMFRIGMPFFFFPSRSMAYYTRAAIRRPTLMPSIARYRESVGDEENPGFLKGSFQIPGTNYYVNPLRAHMGWQMFGQPDFTAPNAPRLEKLMRDMQNTTGLGFGPIPESAARLVQNVLQDSSVDVEFFTGEPQFLIPQQKWLKAADKAEIPYLSAMARTLNMAFDTYLEAMFGEETPMWMKRKTEQILVERGVERDQRGEWKQADIDSAWRQLAGQIAAGIPLGSTIRRVSPLGGDRAALVKDKLAAKGIDAEAMYEAGVNPMAGMRQDEIEDVFEGAPRAEAMRAIRPFGLTPKMEEDWEVHIRRSAFLDVSKKARIDAMTANDAQYSSASIGAAKWDAARKNILEEYGIRLSMAFSESGPFGNVLLTPQHWEDFSRQLGKEPRARHPHDVLLADYRKKVSAQDFDDAAGNFQYEKYQEAQQAALAGQPDDARAYVLLRTFKDLTPLEQERSQYTDTFSAYWTVAETALRAPGVNRPDLILAYRSWRNAREDSKEGVAIAAGVESSYFKQIERIAAKARKLMREKNRVLDAYLVRFKGYKPSHKENVALENAIYDVSKPLEEIFREAR